jgi:hypothetical protein
VSSAEPPELLDELVDEPVDELDEEVDELLVEELPVELELDELVEPEDEVLELLPVEPAIRTTSTGEA